MEGADTLQTPAFSAEGHKDFFFLLKDRIPLNYCSAFMSTPPSQGFSLCFRGNLKETLDIFNGIPNDRDSED